ncbi:MAG TPA: HAMP domain-containing protein [candidate division UBP10 bacterium]|nr:HAMP domain-containing protein [Candidatus Binatota bacterium]
MSVKLRPLFRLRTVLLLVMLAALLAPLAGVYRLLNTEMARQTETELYTQAALIESAYLRELDREYRLGGRRGKLINWIREQGYPTTDAYDNNDANPDELGWRHGILRPIRPTIDLGSDPRLDVPSWGDNPGMPEDPTATTIGHRIAPLLAMAYPRNLSGVRVLDRWGRVVASTADATGDFALEMPEALLALSGRPASVIRKRSSESLPQARLLRQSLTTIARAGEVTVYVGYPIIYPPLLEPDHPQRYVLGAIILGRTPRNVLKALYYKRDQIAVYAAAAVGMLALLVLAVAGTLTRPMRRLVEQSRNVAAGRSAGSVAIPRPGTHEVAELSRVLADTAASLGQRDNYIRDFARTMSHEFKTPLAGIIGSVETLSDHVETMSADERKRFLDNIAHDTGRLQRLSVGLLALARADVLVPSGETTSLDLLLTALAERYEARGLGLTREGNALDARVPMDRDTTETVLSNLLDNSLRHGGSRVTFTGTVVEGSLLRIDVTDNGEGLPAGDPEQLFKPFFSTSADKSGTGLGLAIVRSSLERHGGSIRALDTTPGATFRLELPVV